MVAAEKVNGRMAKKDKVREKDSGKAKLAALIESNDVLKTTLQQIEKQFGEGSIMAAKAGESIESATANYLAERQPSGRFIGMESVGALVAFLCSGAAQDITGVSLPIDGGWSIA